MKRKHLKASLWKTQRDNMAEDGFEIPADGDEDKNPWGGETGGYDDDGDGEWSEMHPPRSSTRQGDRTYPFEHHTRHEETPFGGGDREPLLRRERNVEDAWETIKSKYPEINPKKVPFTASLDEYGRVSVKLNRSGGKSYPLFNPDGEINEKLPATVKKSLGPSAEEVVERGRNEARKIRRKVDELRTMRETAPTSQLGNIDQQIDEKIKEIDQLERETEEVEERMSLRDRVKAIFKKYGFTAFAVLSSVGVVIGVVISSMKKGLSGLAKGVGNGLKALGKKLGELLPGMIGAIASFIFKTAGQVVGFLAENAWLLIVAVVVYFVEQVKKRKAR